MVEIKLFLVVVIAMIVSVGIPMHYFIKKAKYKNTCIANAVAKGIVLGFVLFSCFMVILDKVQDKPPLAVGEEDWCKVNFDQCRSGRSSLSTRTIR